MERVAAPPGFGERFREVTGADKGKRNLRQIAKRLGFSPQTIYDYLDESSFPGPESIRTICREYPGTDPHWLLYGEKPPEPTPETPEQLLSWVNGLTRQLHNGLGTHLQDVINAEFKRQMRAATRLVEERAVEAITSTTGLSAQALLDLVLRLLRESAGEARDRA